METKLYIKDCITLDGRMDEPVWETAKEYTDFRYNKIIGGQVAEVQTSFKILPCEDRIYIGIKCMEPDMDYVKKINPSLAIWTCDDVEIFLSPNGSYFDFYQFAITFEGQTAQMFYSEGGNIRPDPYAPDWKKAIYKGEDHWSMEVELPLTAFYMTADNLWSDTWLVNVSRTRCYQKNNSQGRVSSSWCGVDRSGLESKHYLPIGGFPMRPAKDDIRICTAEVTITDENEKGYCGTLKVKTTNPEAGEFEFSSEYADTVIINLQEGDNEFTVPCCFDQCKRYNMPLQLKRLSDGKEFKRYYPVRIAYEAIKLQFTQPEFRTNFYPGQDYSKVIGKVIANKPVTLKLEGPGIETQVLTPGEDGSFVFDTPNFEIGNAFLTATTADKEITCKIRHLAPTGHMMSWISNGHLVVNGKPVFPRTMSAEYWNGGEAFKRKYDADNLYLTREIIPQERHVQPDRILKSLGFPQAELTRDEKPRKELFDALDELIEYHKDKDFAYYYLADEPECRQVSPIYLKYVYDYIADKDPYHAMRISSRNASGYIDVGDFFETHPYINPHTDENGKRIYGRPFNTLGKYVDDIIKLGRTDRCMGFLGTCYAGIVGKPEPYPTFDEYICNSWAGIVRGAKSLRQYAYHDMNDRAQMYEGSRYIFSSVVALEDLLLDGKRTTLIQNMDVECALYELNGKKVFVLVNFTSEPQTVTLDRLIGTWHNFRNNSTVTGPTFTLKPIEVLIGTNEVLDAGMPTYQETAELIDKLEAQRKSNKSLLFERQKDIKATASNGIGWMRKLFDGVNDNYCWEQRRGDNKFYEIDISKIKPAFNKVVISGRNIDNMEIKVRNGDELSAPEIVEIETEEFSTTFILKETVAPDALRLEFHKDLIELYEIEVFKV